MKAKLTLVFVAIALALSSGISYAQSPGPEPVEPIGQITSNNGGPLAFDTNQLPNGTIYYVLDNPTTGEVYEVGSFNVQHQLAISDPYALIQETYQSGQITSYEATYDNLGVIQYELYDSQMVLIEARPATPFEMDAYFNNKASLLTAESTANLQGNEATPYLTWVINRTVELQACEDDMIAGQLLDFGNQGPVAQTTTVHRMQECIEINSRIQRQVINNLYNLLIAEGIIVP